jgi:hypothetical protein
MGTNLATELTFTIRPENDSVSLALFEKSFQDIHRLIKDLDYAVTKETGTRRWVISAMHSSAPTITLRPLIENSETIEAFVEGIGSINLGGEEPPEHYSEDVLDDILRMSRLFKGKDRAKSLEFSYDGTKTILESETTEKAKHILRSGYDNIGSVEGSLDAINLHGKPMFTIWDRVTKAPVKSYFPPGEDWKRLIKALLEKRVLVTGEISYFANGLPRSIKNVIGLEDATPILGLKKATFGSIPSGEACSDPVAFIRKHREKEYGDT